MLNGLLLRMQRLRYAEGFWASLCISVVIKIHLYYRTYLHANFISDSWIGIDMLQGPVLSGPLEGVPSSC